MIQTDRKEKNWRPLNCYKYGIADNILTSEMIIWNSSKMHLIIPILHTAVHVYILGGWLNLLETRIDGEWGILSRVASNTIWCIDSSIALHWSIKRISSMHCRSGFLHWKDLKLTIISRHYSNCTPLILIPLCYNPGWGIAVPYWNLLFERWDRKHSTLLLVVVDRHPPFSARPMVVAHQMRRRHRIQRR